MTPSALAKAREAYPQCRDESDEAVLERHCQLYCVVHPAIASALEEWGDARLEEAAQEIERLTEEEYDPEADWAASIRALRRPASDESAPGCNGVRRYLLEK